MLKTTKSEGIKNQKRYFKSLIDTMSDAIGEAKSIAGKHPNNMKSITKELDSMERQLGCLYDNYKQFQAALQEAAEEESEEN